MNNVAIRVEGLGKRYRLGANQVRYKTLRESMRGIASAPLRRTYALAGRRPSEGDRGHRPEFWALNDISFEVGHGEVLGIIGRNGAGKSTLLKLLSQITEPTTGRIGVNGRVASLLEVGTGFHPELTGRENIYLNGAILGMSRSEIAGKFAEIVEFAEVERFIDTQVKHYSSGMYLRLAFSVAAHLDPEILIVDEVLAVGDAAFQQRCLKRMSEFSRSGRTVVFVSHTLSAITSLCTRCLLLERGKLQFSGAPKDTVARYVNSGSVGSFAEQLERGPRKGAREVTISKFHVEDDFGCSVEELTSGCSYTLFIHYKSAGSMNLRNCRVSITIIDQLEQYLLSFSTEQFMRHELFLPPNGDLRVTVPSFPLCCGRYFFILFFEVNREIQDWYYPGVEFEVVDGEFFPGSRQYPLGAEGRGLLVWHTWQLAHADKVSSITADLTAMQGVDANF